MNGSTPRRLIVMRHAKSAWDTDAPTDHARPLNKRGRRDAPRVARELVRLGWAPDVVLSSDAKRTRQTFKRMRDVLDDVSIELFDTFYHAAGLGAIRPVVAQLDEGVRTPLVLGHNPGWEDAVGALTGEDVVMTTANAALLSIDATSWAAAIEAEGAWRLEQMLRPRELDS